MVKSIFVSSTFKDFQYERDLLQTHAELALSERLAGSTVSFVDLRWGIDTTESVDLTKVVSICMSEVRSSHPYYVILLGDSYGSTVEKDVLRSLYRLNGMDYDESEKSVTEVEIEATGLFSGNNEYVLVMYRNSGCANPDKRATALAEKVMAHCKRENLYVYSATAQQDGSYLPDDPKGFCDFVVQRFARFLEAQCGTGEDPHLSAAREHAERFAGREKTLAELSRALDDQAFPLFYRIGAEKGRGLTALMAKLYQRQSKKQGCAAAFVTRVGDGALQSAEWVIFAAAKQLSMEDITDAYNFLLELDEDLQYYIFVDGCPEMREDPHLQQLILREYVPDNLHFILSDNDTADADYTLPDITREDAQKILTSGLAFYHKELPREFSDFFTRNADGRLIESPVMLSHFISSICYLGGEEYRLLGKSEDFMGCLSRLFASRLLTFPTDEAAYLRSFFPEEKEKALLLLFAISGFGIDLRTARGVLKTADIRVDSGDLYTLKEKLRSGFMKNEIGYTLSHESLRQAVLSLFTKDEADYFRYLYALHLSENPARLTVPLIFREVLYQYLCLSDFEMIANMLDALYVAIESDERSGRFLCLLAGEFHALRPSECYLRIVQAGNPYACLWLVKNAMPHLSKPYLKNAGDMLCQMHRLTADMMDDPYAKDLFGLYVESLTLQLRGNEAMDLTSEMMKSGRLDQMPMEIFLSMYRMACFSYDTRFAATLLEDMCDEDTPVKDSHFLSYADRMLECTLMLDGNAHHMRDILSRFFHRIVQSMRRDPENEHVPFLMTKIFYYCVLLRIELPLDKDEAVKYLEMPELYEGSVSHQLVWDFLQFYMSRGESGFEAARMIENYSRQDVSLSFVDLYCLSRFFRRICYMQDDAYTDRQKAEIALSYYHRLRSAYDGIANGTHFSELLGICYLLNVYAHGTENESLAKECLTDLKNTGRNLSFMKSEFSFFTQDIARCKVASSQKGRLALEKIHGILEND